MPHTSPFQVSIAPTDVLTWLFPKDAQPPSTKPIWIDAADPTRSLSPAQLLSWAKRLGVGLQRLGLRAGDVVLILSTNHIFVPVVYLGVAGHGYIFSGCNPAYSVSEVKYQMENTGAKVMLVDPQLLDTALDAAKDCDFPTARMFLFDDVPCQSMSSIRDWRSFLGTYEEARIWRWYSMSAGEAQQKTAVLNYSSGTTGLAKGVMITHQNIIANTMQSLYMRRLSSASPKSLKSAATAPGVDAEERWLGFLPLYHAYGQLWSIAAACATLTPCYFMRSFSYPQWLANIQRHRITHIQTAPPLLVMLAKRPETTTYDLSSLQNILCGAAPLSKELQNEVVDRLSRDRTRDQPKLRVVQTWGMTEVTCSSLHVPGLIDDTSGSVGLVDPNCSMKLIDEAGAEVAKDGERGEILVKGPNVCLGYWRNDAATKEAFDEEGYLKTGDVAVRSKEGWFWIVDRKKELIKVRGFQVAPAELEALLLEHHAVADAAVVALAPEGRGDGEERPRAYVVLKEGIARGNVEQEIIDWVQGKVARHKWLTGGIALVHEVPKSPSGKIQRVVLRTWAKRDAGTGVDVVKARL